MTIARIKMPEYRNGESIWHDYPAEYLVLNPQAYDACALLDAVDTVSPTIGSEYKDIPGVGTAYITNTPWAIYHVYYVRAEWIQGSEEQS